MACLIRSSRSLGGVERQLLDHAVRLQARGWEPHLLCLYRDPGEHPLAVAAGAVNLHAVTIADPGPLRTGAAGALRAWLQRLRPDLIHTCDYRSDVLVAALRGFGLVPASPWLAESHGHTADTRAMGLWNRLDRWALRQAGVVVAVSGAWEAALSAAGVQAGRLFTAGNSTAILPEGPVPANIATSSIPAGRTLVFAGRLSPEKGLDVLLGLWPELAAAYPDLHLCVLGAPAPSASYHRHLAILLDQARVHVPGFQVDIRPWLAAAEAVVVPSRWEAWGMTAFEALSAGVPVVASCVGGLPSVCAGAPHAILVDALSPAALKEGIMRALDGTVPRGPALGHSYRSEARFDPARRHERLAALYLLC